MDTFRRLTLIYADPIDRAAILKEFSVTDAHAQKDLVQKLSKMTPTDRYLFLEEWRSDDLDFETFVNGESGDEDKDIEKYASRLYAFYMVAGLMNEKVTMERCRQWVEKYGPTIVRTAEIKKKIGVFGVAWEEQLERRTKYQYNGKYFLDEDGCVSLTVL